MSKKTEVVLNKVFSRLDGSADVGEGVTAFAVYLDPCKLTVAQLSQAKELNIPAQPITLDGGDPAWMLVQYSAKKKKGSKAKAKPFYWSAAESTMLEIDWLSASCEVLNGEFTLGGWPFPLRSFVTQGYL